MNLVYMFAAAAVTLIIVAFWAMWPAIDAAEREANEQADLGETAPGT